MVGNIQGIKHRSVSFLLRGMKPTLFILNTFIKRMLTYNRWTTFRETRLYGSRWVLNVWSSEIWIRKYFIEWSGCLNIGVIVRWYGQPATMPRFDCNCFNAKDYYSFTINFMMTWLFGWRWCKLLQDVCIISSRGCHWYWIMALDTGSFRNPCSVFSEGKNLFELISPVVNKVCKSVDPDSSGQLFLGKHIIQSTSNIPRYIIQI